ncbi:unnamed protein product, partial [Effrenium voratum]
MATLGIATLAELPAPQLATRVQELRKDGALRSQTDFADLLQLLAKHSMWRQSCTLLLEMRFRSMKPFPGNFALAAAACYQAGQVQEAEVIMDKLWVQSFRR